VSDFGRSGGDQPARGDWFRYAWLFVLGSLVFLGVFGFQEGVLLTLLAVYLVLGVAALLLVQLRRRRS
jgi:hypothetical protein